MSSELHYNIKYTAHKEYFDCNLLGNASMWQFFSHFCYFCGHKLLQSHCHIQNIQCTDALILCLAFLWTMITKIQPYIQYILTWCQFLQWTIHDEAVMQEWVKVAWLRLDEFLRVYKYSRAWLRVKKGFYPFIAFLKNNLYNPVICKIKNSLLICCMIPCWPHKIYSNTRWHFIIKER